MTLINELVGSDANDRAVLTNGEMSSIVQLPA